MTGCRVDRRSANRISGSSFDGDTDENRHNRCRQCRVGARPWLVGAGEDLVYGVPHPADPKYNSLPKERLHTPPEAARNTDIVVLATPWSATEAAVKSLGDLSGKIIIDCTNPLAMGSDGLELVLGHTTSGGEQVAACAASRAPRSSGSGAPIGPVVDATGARPPDYRWGSAQMIRFPRPRQNMRAGPAIARRSGDNLPSPRPV
jgi:hypothetical protein